MTHNESRRIDEMVGRLWRELDQRCAILNAHWSTGTSTARGREFTYVRVVSRDPGDDRTDVFLTGPCLYDVLERADEQLAQSGLPEADGFLDSMSGRPPRPRMSQDYYESFGLGEFERRGRAS